MNDYKLFWADAHTNLHIRNLADPNYLPTILGFAREMIDFWPLAYYPQEFRQTKGFRFEDWLDVQEVEKHWQQVCEFAEKNNKPGEFVIFPGYEWQGDGRLGDHNVFYFEDHPPLIRVNTLKKLYAEIRQRRLKAIAIPHHTAYIVGIRGKNWNVYDESLSPFAEIYSVHGCSESDEEWLGLRITRAWGQASQVGQSAKGLNVVIDLESSARATIITTPPCMAMG